MGDDRLRNGAVAAVANAYLITLIRSEVGTKDWATKTKNLLSILVQWNARSNGSK